MKLIFVEKTPGPGSYKLPSEFGHYEAKKKYEWIFIYEDLTIL